MKLIFINIKNKCVLFDYEFIDMYMVGIVFMGIEIKFICLGKVSLVDIYCYFV